MKERDIARALAERENGRCEVQTPVGFIDVLTAISVYEVKEVSQWKAAVGQVLAYAAYYPKPKPKLYLFGEPSRQLRQLIRAHCKTLKIKVVWHQERPDVVATPRVPATPPADALALHICARDYSYDITSACNITLHLPTYALTDAALEAHLDQAHSIFANLLDNTLTTKVRYVKSGQVTVIQRHRDGIQGSPVCYRLELAMLTTSAKRFQVSLPGMRLELPSGHSIGRYNYANATHIPELKQLFNLILHPDLCWTNRYGHKLTSIVSAQWASYGMIKTRTGYKIGC